MTNDLQESFAKATRYFQIGGQLEDRITEQENAINEIKMKFRREKGSKTIKWTVLFCLSIATAFIAAIAYVAGLVITHTYYEGSKTWLQIMFSKLCISSFLVFIISFLLAIASDSKTKAIEKKQKKKYEREVEPILCAEQKKLDEMERQVELFAKENFHLVEFLPMQYRNLQAVSFMLVAVSNGRADSLKEVYNLYEEQLHRWKLEMPLWETPKCRNTLQMQSLKQIPD